MEFRIFGMNLRAELLVLIAIVGFLMWTHLVGSCSRVSLKEGMTAVFGSELGYKMGQGVHGSWDTREQKSGSSIDWRSQDHDTYSSQHVSPNDSMNFFSGTDFAPECCGSNYSANGGINNNGFSSGGCACMSKKQIDYLNERGGNRTKTSDF
tara:strand:+ start:1795 stop:2250 length:456 start_codon:yes stop_codon:yes gene_type:complete